MSMDFPANPAVGDVHTFTDDKGRKVNFEWDGITWNRTDNTPPPPPVRQSAKPLTPPDLKLRRTWHNAGEPPREDYEVIDAHGEKIGRMYRAIAVGGGEAWKWTVYGIAVTNYPPAGQAPTREAAQAAFKAAWAACQPRERGA
jgi:hypothetical protein